MLRNFYICIALVMFLVACSNQGSALDKKWEAFLQSPSEPNYATLSNGIDHCGDEICKAQIVPDYDSVGNLVKLIQAKNVYSIKLGFDMYMFLEPGNSLEEISRGLGAVADTHPVLFLQMVNDYKITDSSLESIINMMSEDIVDNLLAEQQAINHRIKSLSDVKNENLVDTRDKAINFLRNR